MESGGFDAIIGNPPYIRIQTLQETTPQAVTYFGEHYASASRGNYDIYVVFVEKALTLLNSKGAMGYILPHKFFNAQYGEPLRALLSKGRHLVRVVHFGHQQVFDGATTYTCLLFLSKRASKVCEIIRVDDLKEWQKGTESPGDKINADFITSSDWTFTSGKTAELLGRLAAFPEKLESVATRIFQGIKTSADKIYIVEELERQSRRVKVFSPHLGAERWLEPDLLHPLIKGGDSRRYQMTRTNRLILFPYERAKDSSPASLISNSSMGGMIGT